MDFQAYLLLAVVFLAVVMAVFAVGAIFNRGRALRNRLHGLAQDPTGMQPLDGSGKQWTDRLMKWATPMARLATPDEEEELTTLRRNMMNAGFRQAIAPAVFFAAKATMALLLPALAVAFIFAGRFALETQMLSSIVLLLAGLGYYLPNGVLQQFTRARQTEIFTAFPDALDLMIVCVEAGLGLDMAIARSATEIRLRSKQVADELALVGLDLRMGSSRERALRNLAIRTGLEEVAAFVAIVLQADRFGTSIANALRVHSDTLRTRRRQKAEEQAAKLSLKLLFPLIFCIFPALMVVLMGPAMIQVVRIMSP